MKILFYTIDLFQGQECLMPWRTILEVSQRWVKDGHDVMILNGYSGFKKNDEASKSISKVTSPCIDYVWNGVPIKAIPPTYLSVVQETNSVSADILLIQITWRDCLKDLSPLRNVAAKKFVYFTGGIYDLKSSIIYAKRCGVRLAKPYLLESLVPKRILIQKLKFLGFRASIAQTPYTAECARKAGDQFSQLVFTGKDLFETLEPDCSILRRYNLYNKKWMLFSGAPAAARGACELLEAIDKTKEKNLKVVMLMRTDIGSNFRTFEEKYSKIRHKDKIVLIREKVTRYQLKAFYSAAYYKILPFLIIPSEIPVTFLEVMSCGTPIITFMNGGTTRYLKEGLCISKKSVYSLAATLDIAWRNESMRNQKSVAAKKLMDQHPMWDDVSKQWLDVIY